MSWLTPPTRRSYPCRGYYLKILREKRGWTQEEFAAVAGYSPRLIRKAEKSDGLNPETIEDLAEALSTVNEPVYPEDLVSDPIAAVRLWIESYDKYEREMLAHCGHVHAEDFVFWCAGAEEGVPFAGTYHGKEGLQEFLDRFFSLIIRPKVQPLIPTFSLAENEVIARFVEYPGVDSNGGPSIWIVLISKFERGKIVRMENYFDTHTGQNILTDHKPGKVGGKTVIGE